MEVGTRHHDIQELLYLETSGLSPGLYACQTHHPGWQAITLALIPDDLSISARAPLQQHLTRRMGTNVGVITPESYGAAIDGLASAAVLSPLCADNLPMPATAADWSIDLRSSAFICGWFLCFLSLSFFLIRPHPRRL